MRSRGERRRAMPLVAGLGAALMSVTGMFGASVLNGNPADAVTSSPTAEYSGGQMMAADPNGGYWTVDAAGAVTPYGGAPDLGSPAHSNITLSQPLVGMAAMPDGNGYWLVASDGGIFSYGDATFYGSTGAIHLNKPIVGMATTPDGGGYWLVASDGGIFTYGDAQFFGSTGAVHLNQPIVGMAATADGAGYWLVASDGGIFSYGDASFYGSTGAIRLDKPIVGMAGTPDGGGYWLVASDGGLFSYGDATFEGSTAGTDTSALGIVVDPPDWSYALVSTGGTATFFGRRHHPTSNTSNSGSTTTTSSTTAPAPTTTTTAPAPTTTTTTRPPTTTTTTVPPTTTTTTVPPTTTTTTQPTTTSALAQGVYIGPANPSGVKSFASTTGTSPTVASDYLPTNGGWTGMDGSGGSLNWLLGPWKGSGYTLSLGVPMIPDNSSGTAQGTLAQGATGAYNSYFVTLAQNLVAGGAANAYLRIGWEFDGSWTIWAATTASAEASYASYFQQIVTAMRSVSGEAFRFVWNPDATAFTNSGYSVQAAYPGNSYVNVIGLDLYDQTWVTPQTPANAWSSTVLPALTAAQQFASSNGKPLALAEWGVAIRSDGHGLGDDPYYINQMISWMKTSSHNVAFESYFDFNDSGANYAITGGSFPNSLAAFEADLG
jgi:hypothetical protein